MSRDPPSDASGTVWWQDDPDFMVRPWDHYDADDYSAMTLSDGRRLVLTYVRDHGPVCGLVYRPGHVCSLTPAHECPHLAVAEHYVTKLGERTVLTIRTPTQTGRSS